MGTHKVLCAELAAGGEDRTHCLRVLSPNRRLASLGSISLGFYFRTCKMTVEFLFNKGGWL